MSRNNLELARWGDGSVRIAFWDSMHGEDVIIEITPDGAIQHGHEVVGYDESAELIETRTPVNLNQALLGILKYIEELDKE